MPPRPPLTTVPVVAPPAQKPERNEPSTDPASPSREENISPGEGRRDYLQSLPTRHLLTLFNVACNDPYLSHHIIKHDEPTILVRPDSDFRVWAVGRQRMKRILAYPLTPPIALAVANTRRPGAKIPGAIRGGRSPPRQLWIKK
ncbi:MAG: hypothetical protein QNJ74_16145 [Trichodesmium sp. MO_231.B1]|nr:hypothetical protein [Trichodesmium sp. MO_231.B1]